MGTVGLGKRHLRWTSWVEQDFGRHWSEEEKRRAEGTSEQGLGGMRAVCGSEWPRSVWLGDGGWKVGWVSVSESLACHAKKLLGKIQQRANGSELQHYKPEFKQIQRPDTSPTPLGHKDLRSLWTCIYTRLRNIWATNLVANFTFHFYGRSAQEAEGMSWNSSSIYF